MGCSGRSEVGDRCRSGAGDDVVELYLLSPDPWSMNKDKWLRQGMLSRKKEKKGRTEENANMMMEIRSRGLWHVARMNEIDGGNIT